MGVDTEVSRENWERYVYIRDGGHTDYIKKARKCENYVAGLQWEESIRRKLESVGKPVITINEVFASFAAMCGELLRNNTDIAFKPAKNGQDDVATVLTKLWLHAQRNSRYSWLRSEVAADGFITSRGYFDVRANFDDHMMGELKITKENPINILIDPDAEEYDPDSWQDVIKTKWFSPKMIEATYGKAAYDYFKDRSGCMYGYDSVTFDNPRFDVQDSWWKTTPRSMQGDRANAPMRRWIRVIERQYKQNVRAPHFVDMQTGDVRRVPPNWDDRRAEEFASRPELGLAIVQRYTPTVKWCVTADDYVLHESDSPYKKLTVVPYFPYFRYGRTIGLIEHALSPQEMLNKTISQELHVVNTTANSGWLLKAGALQNMSIEELERRGAETGLVIELNDIGNISKIEPNQVPTGLDRISFKASDYVQRVLNTPDSLRGFDREDVAARSTEIKRQQAATSMAKPFDNLAYTDSMVAERAMDIFQAFYTDQRVLQVTGQGPLGTNEQIIINQVNAIGEVLNDLTVGEYSVQAIPVPPRDTFEQQEFNEVMQMRQLGIPVPDKYVVETSSFSRKAELLADMQAVAGESAAAQQQMMQLQNDIAALDLELKKADIGKKAADSKLSEARAVETMAKAGQGENGDLEAMKAAEELRLEWEKMQGEFEMRQAELAAELDFKRQELEMKREELQMKMQLEQQKTAANMQMQRQKNQADIAANQQKAQTDRAIAITKAESQNEIAQTKAKAQAQAAKNKPKPAKAKA